ncbi:PREDICTED: dimethyladenosine transferase 2, mitochondrial [Habropoda laboriosa]|uniref:dimethyladenosine transferase 2, mitochondrial n=1 Tax=Habropoda laboriosa TaxID=597456 RepID=UPI00083D6F35|nr:PREDICTED: dimethyladenosine transferase 2, mitochondrial [Habropoda laboriosa]
MSQNTIANVIQLRCQKIVSKHIDIENLGKDKNNKLFSIIEEYVQNVNPKLKNKILQNYFSFSIYNTDPYLISHTEGKKFVTLIKDDLLENMPHVIELNPGFGLLTECLLQAGVPFLNLYERNNDFYSDLYNLYKKYPKRFNLRKANLFKISKMLNLHSTSTFHTNICELLSNIPERKWEENTCMQVIGTTTKTLFLRHLIMSVLFQSGFMLYGRPTFYLAISPYVWNKFAQLGNRINTTHIMFDILFDYKILGTLDRNAFIPWEKRKLRNKSISQNYDIDVLFVTKLEPKPNLYTIFGGKNNLIHFWHFVRHHFYKPSQRVIPALEKIIPGCGIKLISKLYTVTTVNIDTFRLVNLSKIFVSIV